VPERKTRKKEHKHSCKSAPHNSKVAKPERKHLWQVKTQMQLTTFSPD
jgi:hypothetical protein